ncbi:MAG: hypothetical protein ACRDSK_11885 [Actinophytocola sp.]|uniref:hypothetical protein n=1 Tax=Actinophytocola sp. TaxID=1872138 RepID=UPI003D6AF719
MRIRTDDEVYRVDAVWLGPPKATMPWRARYVAWGVGVFVFLIVLTVERRMGISLFWSVAWGIVATIVITRLICSRISHERPLTSVTAMWVRELTAPREATAGEGGAVSATRVRIRVERPRPKPRVKRGSRPRPSAKARHRTVRHQTVRTGKTKSARRKEVRGVRKAKARA